MYSQNGEEEHILANTGPTGHFLDIGAYDGKTFSNTLALVERGWSGVCVEPSPECFSALQKLHHDNQKITLVNALLGFQWQLRKFYNSPEANATSEQGNYDRWKGVSKFREIFLSELPIFEFLKIHPGPYDFMNIDTEGTSWRVLQSIVQDIPLANLVCVEYDSFGDQVELFFKNLGYIIVYKSGENIIARKS